MSRELALKALCWELQGLHAGGPAQPCEPAEGEMWVKTVKKCYLSTWVPFCSFLGAAKKKIVQVIKAC